MIFDLRKETFYCLSRKKYEIHQQSAPWYFWLRLVWYYLKFTCCVFTLNLGNTWANVNSDPMQRKLIVKTSKGCESLLDHLQNKCVKKDGLTTKKEKADLMTWTVLRTPMTPNSKAVTMSLKHVLSWLGCICFVLCFLEVCKIVLILCQILVN